MTRSYEDAMVLFRAPYGLTNRWYLANPDHSFDTMQRVATQMRRDANASGARIRAKVAAVAIIMLGWVTGCTVVIAANLNSVPGALLVAAIGAAAAMPAVRLVSQRLADKADPDPAQWAVLVSRRSTIGEIRGCQYAGDVHRQAWVSESSTARARQLERTIRTWTDDGAAPDVLAEAHAMTATLRQDGADGRARLSALVQERRCVAQADAARAADAEARNTLKALQAERDSASGHLVSTEPKGG